MRARHAQLRSLPPCESGVLTFGWTVRIARHAMRRLSPRALSAPSPLVGEGWGRGCSRAPRWLWVTEVQRRDLGEIAHAQARTFDTPNSVPKSTPLPVPPPQGGREPQNYAHVAGRKGVRRRSAPKLPRQLGQRDARPAGAAA